MNSQLKIPNLRSSQYSDSDTFNGMDMDDTSIDDIDADDDAKMIILQDDGITPGNGNINDAESTINERSEMEHTWSCNKTYHDGITRPGLISRTSVKVRKYMIYKENKW
eukprot:29658_1